ncbi:MAG: hypothetical protein K0Q43_4763, partial [Ramlibacter sp.]|nr:hypothetical protein [Ramlibacter sp.]
GTARRLLDLPAYVPEGKRKNLISLNEVYETVQRSIWSELATGAEIDRLRRNLQREHIKRLQTLLTRGSAAMPPDALSLLRWPKAWAHWARRCGRGCSAASASVCRT